MNKKKKVVKGERGGGGGGGAKEGLRKTAKEGRRKGDWNVIYI